MKIEDLPKWMSLIPTLIGVGLAITGMYVFPMYGLRNTLGPIIGLPIGMVVGVSVLALIARRRIDDEPPLADGEVRLCQLSLEEQQRFAREGPKGSRIFGWRPVSGPGW